MCPCQHPSEYYVHDKLLPCVKVRLSTHRHTACLSRLPPLCRFFLRRHAFDCEWRLYVDPLLTPIQPTLHAASHNSDGHARAPDGHKLPPYLVLDRGLPLSNWRETPRLLAALVGMVHEVAALLARLHASGRVHRDLKPDNVVLIQNNSTWRLIDFGLVATSGAAPSGAAAFLARINARCRTRLLIWRTYTVPGAIARGPAVCALCRGRTEGVGHADTHGP